MIIPGLFTGKRPLFCEKVTYLTQDFRQKLRPRLSKIEFTLPVHKLVYRIVRHILRPVIFIFVLSVVACSSAGKRDKSAEAPTNSQFGQSGSILTDDEDSEGEMLVSDPWESFNRKMHAFNEFFLRYAIQPLARGWQFLTPAFLREGLNNFFHWAYTPGRLVNNLAQAKFKGAAKETVGFLINGTAGMLGFYDAAKDIFSLERTNEDSDQTLGKWGLPEGPYVVWPFIGPNTVRGTFGFVGDLFLQPQTVIVPVYIKPETLWVNGAIIAGVYSFRAINRTSLDVDQYDNLTKDAIDPYAFLRDIYLQNTRKNVAD
jgi:phospholipid-binding lipoprotein MlaA